VPTSQASPTFAVIADIHGNVPALEAVLADLERVQPDRTIMAGDFVNRGPQSGAVLERVTKLDFPAISGNHDTWLASLSRGVNIPEDWDAPWWTPVRLATRDMTPAWAEWIDRLPFSLQVDIPGTAPVRIVHGSARDAREGMGRMRTDEQVAASLAGVEEDFVIGAHIHYPYERHVAGKQVVVIGAVGCPFNGDIAAQYGLFTWDGEHWQVEHRAVPYDHEPVYEAWRAGGYLEDGSAASRLMMLEHMTARTHYVPFWEWCLELGLPLDASSYPRFASEFDREPLPD
jgi:predicted phosphodiesterase